MPRTAACDQKEVISSFPLNNGSRAVRTIGASSAGSGADDTCCFDAGTFQKTANLDARSGAAPTEANTSSSIQLIAAPREAAACAPKLCAKDSRARRPGSHVPVGAAASSGSSTLEPAPLRPSGGGGDGVTRPCSRICHAASSGTCRTAWTASMRGSCS